MITFGSGYDADDTVTDGITNGITSRILAQDIAQHVKEYLEKGGRISLVDEGFCVSPNLTSWTNDEAAIKARKNGTKNSKLRAVK